jgi:hypothetical protein
MPVRSQRRLAAALTLAWALGGCTSSGPAPSASDPPPAAAPTTPSHDPYAGIVSGSSDSVSAIPGSPDSPYRIRFRQIEPGSDKFTFYDRDLSFYFRPTPSALRFEVENKQNQPVWIEWDRSIFYTPFVSGKLAHSTTRWEDRYRVQAATQIPGLQRYTDFVFPLEFLLEPGGSTEQLHRPLIPEDGTAPQYEGKVFGVDLVFRIEDKLRTYPFRFRVESILPR